jgi:hypothetical protein
MRGGLSKKISNLMTSSRGNFGSYLRSKCDGLFAESGAGYRRLQQRVSHVLPTHQMVDLLAVRVEQAYGLRVRRWWRGCSTSRVWHAAALRLWEAHAHDPECVPLDAELFVASQPISVSLPDPWTELTHHDAAKRFRMSVKRIIRRLRTELRREVVRGERSIEQGEKVETMLGRTTRRLSAMGSYILAIRAGRDDLAERFAAAAAAQHQSCPLYRLASISLLPVDLYPDESLADDAARNRSAQPAASATFSLHRNYKECPN